MPVKISIVICAYNARHRIAGPLNALSEQSLPSPNTWEVLLIDNGSTDGTAILALELNDRLRLPLRIIHEPTLGLTHARTCAARESIGKWLAFCDDDNLPAPNWLKNVLDFAEEHPRVGMFGGRVIPLVERPDLRPDDFTDDHFGLLGCRDRGAESLRLERGFPLGAGMVIRRDLQLSICQEIGIYSVGRQGATLTGCEDAEIASMVRSLGWELWYCGNQLINHVMPPHRVRHEYRDALSIQAIKSAAWLEVLQSGQLMRGRSELLLRAVAGWVHSFKYALLAALPAAGRAAHWRDFYAAEASGWYRLAADFDRVNSILCKLRERVDGAVDLGSLSVLPNKDPAHVSEEVAA